MGEKLLAQRLIRALRETSGRTSRAAGTLLDWAADQRDWLWPQREWPDSDSAEGGTGNPVSWAELPSLAAAIDTGEPAPPLFACLDAVADLAGFDAFEREVLRGCAGLNRIPRLVSLRCGLYGSGVDLPALVGLAAGAAAADAGRRVRASAPVALGLLFTADSNAGDADLGVDWQLARAIDAGLTCPDRLVEALVGAPQAAALRPQDFAERGEALRLLVRLLSGALRKRAAGINVLLYGPPGSGKTEFARMLAAEVGVPLYAAGESDPDGEEPSRLDRLSALKRGQRLLARNGKALLLFDEMEDLFSEAGSLGGLPRRQAGSKIFVNRLLEANLVPTVWTSNSIESLDPAQLRRMSFILRMDYPGLRARERMVARIAEAEGVAEAGAGLERLLPAEEAAGAVARTALRATALAGGGAADAEAVGRSLLLGLRGGREEPPTPVPAADLELYEADRPIAGLVERIAAPGAPTDVSLLLTGPPGTGKTALAALLADRLGRQLAVKRASDLLSSWVGGTEANIAAAFAEAREQGAVLLFDEADSLLLDRAEAQRSWEVSQVNELLTWMDSHPLPFVAATNWPQGLDPATLRRFVFKIALRPLSPERAERAFARFFGTPAPAGLARLSGLTPGDFALVARQLRFRAGAASPAVVLALLEAEVRAKPEVPAPIGF